MAIFCTKPLERPISIIPGRSTPSGLTHVYKESSQWKFIAEEDYQKGKTELPDLSFAILYPFSNFETKALDLPDLAEILEKIKIDEAAITHGSEVTSSNTAESFSSDEPLYCSITKDGKNQKHVYLKEGEVFSDNTPQWMNPLILYRVKRPAKDLSKLPVIPLAKFYQQSN